MRRGRIQASDHKEGSEERGGQIETVGPDISRLVFALLETVFLAGFSPKICLGFKLLSMIPLNMFANNLNILHSEKGLLGVYLNYQNRLPRMEMNILLVSAFNTNGSFWSH